jgi:ankyrin repeat protein
MTSLILTKIDSFQYVINNDLEKLQKFLNHKPFAVYNSQNNQGNTFLIFACMFSHINIIKWLLSKNCDVNLSNFDGKTALFYAIKNNLDEVIKILIQKGASTFGKTRTSGLTILMQSAIYGNMNLFIHLLNNGSDIDAVDNEGMTVFFHSILHKQFNIAFLYIDIKKQLSKVVGYNSNITKNYRDNKGNDAIFYVNKCIAHINSLKNKTLLDENKNIIEQYIKIKDFMEI